MMEKITAGQQVKRPKTANYAKIHANLQELVQKYQHQNMIDFLRGCSYNIKLQRVLLFLLRSFSSVIQFVHFLPKFSKFKNNARSDLIIIKCRS